MPFGTVLVMGRYRLANPASVITAFLTLFIICFVIVQYQLFVINPSLLSITSPPLSLHKNLDLIQSQRVIYQDDIIYMVKPFNFLIETRDELQKVTWPTRTEVTRLTIVVILFSIIVGVYIGGIDLIFTKLLAEVLK